jgi:ribosomal protein S18 acetylase RimI-like enzyme
VAYLGVVPEARGRGLGMELIARALREAWAAGVRSVTLSVDARNRPAWKLYQAAGFEPHDRREVYLAIWRKASEESKPPPA